MDSLTHIAIGACIGEAFVGRQIGKKVMVWGALAQSIPDIDFIASFWMKPAEELLAHRGFTHSILFGALIVPLFALLADRWHRPHDVTIRTWLLFFGVSVFSHLLIDGFNNYGVGWFVPFSRTRFSFNTIYVADFFFSIWPGIAMFGLIFLNKQNRWRKFWATFGLSLSALYLVYGIYNKTTIDSEISRIAKQKNLVFNDYFTTPTPLNNWLWFIVLKIDKDSGYYIGYRSVFDRKPEMDFYFFKQNDFLLNSVREHEDIPYLTRFSRGFYTIEQWGDTLTFNNLQFGQMLGWENPHAHFVFHYYLNETYDNRLVVQRGRFAGWNKQTVLSLIKRIRGN